MYQLLATTAVITAEPKKNAEGMMLGCMSYKTFTTKNGDVHTSKAYIILHFPEDVGKALKDQLKKGVVIAFAGSLIGTDKGNPIIREKTDSHPAWTAFDVKAYEIFVLGTRALDATAKDMFRFVIIGNLGRDPEMRYIPADARPVTTFSVAVNSTKRNPDTKAIEKSVIWVRVSAWDKLAENANQFLQKGSQVCIEGTLQFNPETGAPNLWKRQDGTDGVSFEMTAYSLKFLGKKSDLPAPEYEGPATGTVDGDDIPF